MSDLFREELFWGAGEHSGALAWNLTRQFHDAMTIQSGLQQPDRPTSEDEARSHAIRRSEDEYNLEQLVRSIAIALGQKKILRNERST